MFQMPQEFTVEERRAIFDRRAERTRIRFAKRKNSPRHRANVRRMLDRWQRIYALGPRRYFLKRWPIWFIAMSAGFLGAVYMIDGSFHTLLRPRVASIASLVLLIGSYKATRLGWRLIRPV